MKYCAFTIVAKNYIGLGQILGSSLQLYNPEMDFKIFVADEFEHPMVNIPSCVVMAKDIVSFSEEEWTEMSFKYDLTEFCTSIKPSCFTHLFSKGYEKVIYFDPDIYIFSSIEEILSKLDLYDIALTPQIAGIHPTYNGEHPEWAMNVNGIFNLGFCAMRNSKQALIVLDWWQKRLKDNCFADRSTGNFTDQKWMDWMPGLLGNESLYIFHHLGMNMAPWNYFERELYQEGDDICVKFRTDDNPQRHDKLIFIHFAGYDYQKMKQGIISRKRIENLQEYNDLKLATDIYQKAIIQNQHIFDAFINQKYSYATYANGLPIATFHRRLYHGLLEKEEQLFTSSPFSIGEGSFYNAILERKMITEEKLEKFSRSNLPNMDKKKRIISWLFKTLYFAMGYKRYVLFVKSLYFYCRPEAHTFLLKHPK